MEGLGQGPSMPSVAEPSRQLWTKSDPVLGLWPLCDPGWLLVGGSFAGQELAALRGEL